MAQKRRYITTAIDYPNAAPHMGHVLEKVLADVCARWFRLRGDDVRFQVGTDEHGIKIQRTAEKEKVTPQQLVDRNVPLFQDLYTRLGISYDVFVRTTDREKHWPTVIALWRKLRDAGVLEKRSYEGLYCSGCERFMTKRDLVDGLCPIHKVAPEKVTEENWFFTLSNFEKDLKKLLTEHWDKEEYRIVPEFRAKETLALLDNGLEDVSFSRPKTSLSWGIPVPDDEEQVMYVWCDALTNYISGLGYFTDREDRSFWDNAEVTHVIGKDIARFHALIWPAMLRNAGVRIPDRLLIHGFLTSEGEKMSKSLGNVVVPDDVLTKFGGNPDPLRFYLSHEVPVGNDGDFSWKRIEELYDSKLRNQLGNLLNRVLVLVQKEDGRIILNPDFKELSLVFTSDEGWSNGYVKFMDKFEPSIALQNVMHWVDACNVFIDVQKPWKLSGEQKMTVLADLAEALRHISLMLLPFIPEGSQKIAQQLNVPYADQMLDRNFTISKELRTWGGAKGWKSVSEPSILFPPLS